MCIYYISNFNVYVQKYFHFWQTSKFCLFVTQNRMLLRKKIQIVVSGYEKQRTMKNRDVQFPCQFFILCYKMKPNRKFRNHWEKLPKMFHLKETSDFSFPIEFQNPEKNTRKTKWTHYNDIFQFQ